VEHDYNRRKIGGLKMKVTKKAIVMVIFVLFVFMIMNSFYYSPAVMVSKSQGTVLSDNWWIALNWIKNNTEECSVVATYWDPGHFITGIARRPVVFDGASQSSLRTIKVSGNLSADEIRKIAVIDKYEASYDEKTDTTSITTARIQDIATSLYTDNETLAYEIIKKYRKNNCSTVYYIASSDLLGKSTWWTYFSTWNPAEKGQKYVYYMVPLYSARPVPNQNAVAYMYLMSEQQSFVIYEFNKTSMIPYLQQGSNVVKVEKLFYFNKNGFGLMHYEPDAEVKGMLWLSPERQTLIFIPPELENSMFTRMFLFNGQGLEYFEYVDSWGGEVKLFKLDFEKIEKRLAEEKASNETETQNTESLTAETLPVEL
jgi:dolichyl-phosphooligosaccharide-protein glycotransferase